MLVQPFPWHTVSVRTRNILRSEGIESFGDLTRNSADNLLAVRNVGPRCLYEVRQVLKKHGLLLRGDPEEETKS